MADKSFTTYGAAAGANCFKEAVCVNTPRIYDSCSSKDCLEDLQVYFTAETQTLINTAVNVKYSDAEVLGVELDVESIPFNRGFYSVDITYTFLLTLDVYQPGGALPTTVQGVAFFTKKVILFGSEGSVRSFRSGEPCLPQNGAPTALIQVAEPVCLGLRFCDIARPAPDCAYVVSESPCFPEPLQTEGQEKFVYVSLGIFSIVQLERNVQMMIPVYDYSVPDKESVSGTAEDPCEIFRRIQFPVNEFFPPRLLDSESNDLK